MRAESRQKAQSERRGYNKGQHEIRVRVKLGLGYIEGWGEIRARAKLGYG